MKIVFNRAGLGDELAVTPLIREVRRRSPRERIRVEGARFPEILEGNPWIGGTEDQLPDFSVAHGRHWDAGTLPKKFARQYGLELEDDVPEIFLTEAELHETFGVRSWARTVAVDVWASQVSRRWPGDRFLELAGLLRTAGWKVIEVGRHSGTRIPAWRSFLNQLTVRQTAAVLSRCGLYIGNDSGLFHLAAAVGTPQVAVFGTVPPARRLYWSTVGVKSDHLCPKACEGAVTCSEAPQGSRCLPEISAAKVMHAVEVAARRHGIT